MGAGRVVFFFVDFPFLGCWKDPTKVKKNNTVEVIYLEHFPHCSSCPWNGAFSPEKPGKACLTSVKQSCTSTYKLIMVDGSATPPTNLWYFGEVRYHSRKAVAMPQFLETLPLQWLSLQGAKAFAMAWGWFSWGCKGLTVMNHQRDPHKLS